MLIKGLTMNKKVQYDINKTKITNAGIAMANSKAYKQVLMRQLCKHMKVPADTWRGITGDSSEKLQSLATTLVAYKYLTKPQWCMAKSILETHRR